MTDYPYSPRPVARWFTIAAIASIAFMIIGCAGYLMTVTADPADLPVDQRGLVEAAPVWMMAAYAIAVWVGLAGTVMLLLRKKISQPLLLVSLLAAVVTFLPYAIVPAVSDNISTHDVVAAIVVLAITWTIFWFARHSKQRGWLR